MDGKTEIAKFIKGTRLLSSLPEEERDIT